MKRQQRLRRPADFQHVRTTSRSRGHALVALHASSNAIGHTRVGITVGKRVARSAVLRNQVRRRLREVMRQFYPRLLQGQDLVLIARGASVSASYETLRKTVAQLISRADLWALEAQEAARVVRD